MQFSEEQVGETQNDVLVLRVLESESQKCIAIVPPCKRSECFAFVDQKYSIEIAMIAGKR